MSEPTAISNRIPSRARAWAVIASLLSLALFMSTLQWHVNGSQSPYATDVGEIQNALPRWGTIHFTGYPQYTFLGSLFVSSLRLIGIGPAAGASLFSALWGALTVGGLTLLLIELGVWETGAALLAFLFALTGSMWIDASLAEIHTMTMFLTVGSLYLALRYGRYGARRDILWLVAVYTQGIVHQRAMVFLAPTLLILVWSRMREILTSWQVIVSIALLAPLTYLYLPLRDWMGAEWTFNAPGTWQGFWSMIMDTKAGRIIALPSSMGELGTRMRLLANLIHDDLAIPVTMAGMLGLAIPLARGRERSREGMAWLLGLAVHGALCLIIWEGRVSDALLAAKLPLVLLAILGLGYALTWCQNTALVRVGSVALVALMCYFAYLHQQPRVVAITRDPASEAIIAAVENLPQDPERGTIVWTLWGHDYWALRYAQTYRRELSGLTLADHNASPSKIVAHGDRLVTLRKTFYQRPVSWWEERIGPVGLSMPSAGLVEIAPHSAQSDTPAIVPLLTLENGVDIASADLSTTKSCTIQLDIVWQAQTPPREDWAVAVHLLAEDPPAGPEHILAQADQQHPVSGLYPVSGWFEGEQVHDVYVLIWPEDAQPAAVRVGMYRQDNSGQFTNTSWLTLPIP